jgi:hypothetical protein
MLICPLFVLAELTALFAFSLTAANINLNTTQNTKIKGANLQATNQLNLNTKNLEVSRAVASAGISGDAATQAT